MIGIRMWLRATWKAFLPAMFAVQAIVMLNVQGTGRTRLPEWSLDWSWMLSVWSGGTLLMSPLATAAAVYLTQKAWSDPTRTMVAGLSRAVRSRIDVVGAIFLQGLFVQAVTLGLAALACASQHGETAGLTLPWQLFTGPAALLASTCLGGVIGEYWKDPWAIPASAVAVFLSQRIFYWHGYPELLTTEMATGAVVGARPMPRHLIATIVVNVLAAAGFVSLQLWRVRVGLFRNPGLLLIALACFVGVVLVFHPFVASHAVDTYERLR